MGISEEQLAKLERLAKLRDAGALTEEEFAKLKASAIAGIPVDSEDGVERGTGEVLVEELPGRESVEEVDGMLRRYGLAQTAEKLGILAADLDRLRKKYGIEGKSWKLKKMLRAEVRAIGVNGQLELRDSMLTISRRGAAARISQGFKGDKTINVAQISAVQLRLPTRLTRGYIQFSFSGSQEDKGGLFSSVTDENSVLFTKDHEDEFIHLKNEIERLR